MTAVPSVDARGVSDRPTTSFPALDTMRGLAAIAVVATHVGFWSGAYSQSYWGPTLARLDIGVAVFFVLSGFLLSRPFWERALRGLPAPGIGRYLYKRALRIVPVYVLTVVVAMLALPGNQGASAWLWVRTLVLANVYVDEELPHGLTQMWSLSTEVAFYLALPILMVLVVPRRQGPLVSRRFAVVSAALVAVNALWILVLVPRLDGLAGLPGVWLPGYLAWFGVGLLLGAAQVQLQDGPATTERTLAHALRDLGRLPGVCWTAALALFAIASTPVAGPYTLDPATLGEAVVKNVLYAVVAGLVILPAIFVERPGRFLTVLGAPVLRHVGLISYGIFCLHLVVLELVTRWRDMELFAGRTVELFLLTLLGSVAAAEVVHRMVEKPLTRLRRVGRRDRPAQPAAPTG